MKLKMSKEVDLGKEPIGHLLLILALPSITSQVVNALYNMVDRMYIGHIPEIGSAALTGVGVCFPLIMIISAFAYLLGMGGAPRASDLHGPQRQQRRRKDHWATAFRSLIIVSIVLTAVVLIFQDAPALSVRRQREHHRLCQGIHHHLRDRHHLRAADAGHERLHLRAGLLHDQHDDGTASARSPTSSSTRSSSSSSTWACAGRRWATVHLSGGLSAVWVVCVPERKARAVLRLQQENLHHRRRRSSLPCVALGVAPFTMQATESVLVLCFNSSLLRYGGDLAVGAMTILSSVMQFAMLPLQGLTQGGAADHQLQLRRHAGTARQKGIPPADHRLLHLLILAVGRRGTVSIIVRRHLYQ